MNEFDGVPSSELKKQIRGIDKEIEYAEFEGWREDEYTGREYFDVEADYFISDLSERRHKLKIELARRISKKSQP